MTTAWLSPALAQTHAEASSFEWKGIDVSTVIGNSAYPDNNTIASGYPFILYNVGTGRFVIQGGDWAMEGRLFFHDFGRQMYLYSNGRINGAITEYNSSKNSFCVRPPELTSSNWKDWDKRNLTTLLDGDTKWSLSMNWNFERVKDASDTDTYTYYMYQKSKSETNNTKYYLGAAWGECHNDSPGKGEGKLVYWDDDRSCWTTVDVTDEAAIKKVPAWQTTLGSGKTLRQENGKAMLENGDVVDIQKLYQWRIISREEFISVLNSETVGLNPSISIYISDRDFTRNAEDFFGDDDHDPYDQWTTSTLSGYEYGNTETQKRYAYTWGDYQKTNDLNKNNQQQRTTVKEPWDTPLRLKAVFDKWVSSSDKDDQPAGKKNAKYGFLEFEGVGTIYTNFKAPRPGWYEIECAGFCQGNNYGYMFARVIPDSRAGDAESTFDVPTDNTSTYGKVNLGKVPSEVCNRTFNKDTYMNVLEAGKELLQNGDAHRQSIWVLVTQDDIDRGNATIRVGIGKDGATMSAADANNAYHDTDWVCVDDFRASFMGTGPVFFYDDMETLNYLDDVNHENLFLQHEYMKGGSKGRFSGAATLQRKFTTGAWNTFSFLLPLTGEQVRNAFGEESELLEMNKVINSGSKDDCVIDFTRVNLVTLNNVVTPGKFYLLKPSKEANLGENPRGMSEKYYDLGRMNFSSNAADADDPDYKFPVVDLSTWKGSQGFTSQNRTNDGAAHVTYIKTPSFSKFRVDEQGSVITKSQNGYDLGIVDDSYATKGAYVMSGGKMYELNRDTPIKGFRGWITLAHSIFDEPEEAHEGAKIAINGIIEGEMPPLPPVIVTDIEKGEVTPVNTRTITGVYDLAGRKVGETIDNLPKGLYIVGGKKLLMK